MASDEKNSTTVETFEHATEDAARVTVISGSEAYNQALLKEKPSLFNGTTILLILCCLIGFFCPTMNGFDGSLLGSLLANTQFKSHFHGSNDGVWAGIVASMYQIGNIVALPFVGPCVDTWGRRAGMFIGSMFIIIGTIVSGLTVANASINQFMGGRFLLGFGVSITTAAGPIYVVEMAHPAYRGVVTAYCNTFWFTGSILASGSVRGALGLSGNLSWALPVWLQLVFSGLIASFAFVIPESPRWLYVNGKMEKAVNTLTRWHGYGNADSPWVKLELSEYEEFLHMNGADKRWWDYRILFKKRSSRYRLMCNIVFSIFSQWAGNGVLSYFLSAVLDTAGYRDPITQTNVILGYACFQFVFALTGAAFVDKVGRRPLMMFSMACCCLTWIGISTSTGIFSASGELNAAAAKATVAFIFIFGGAFSVGITPLQGLYAVEVLSYEMRAKGMAFCSLAVGAAGLLSQFAWPVALANIGWKTYLIFIVWDAFQTLVFYFALPETKKRTLEEIDQIFEASNPVKASLKREKIALDSENTIVATEQL